MNKVILIGNLGKDPEIRTTQAGDKIANFSIATSESWTDKASGERKERTEWHRVVIFNARTAEVAEKYLRKGSKVSVVGKLQTRKWTDQSGADRYSTEVVLPSFGGELILLSRANGGDGGDGAGEQDYGGGRPGSMADRAPAGGAAASSEPSDLDEEIPF